MSFFQKANNINIVLDKRQVYAILAFTIMMLGLIMTSNLTVNTSNPSSNNLTGTTDTSSTNTFNPYIADSVGQVLTNGYTSAVAVNPAMQLTVLVALKYSNPTVLNNYLTDVQNPSSAIYHEYMTKQQFYNTFSPSQQTYTNLVNYFSHYGLTVSSYADRVSIKLVGTVAQFENAFNTKIQQVQMNSKTFYAPTKSLKLGVDASSISAVVGLNNYLKAQLASPISQAVSLAEQSIAKSNYATGPVCVTYQLDPAYCSNETLVGSDMQNAYQVNQLFSGGNYAYNETVATILWNGVNPFYTSYVAPFNPADLVNYFSSTLPAGEPQPNVCGNLGPYNQAINQSYICGVPVDGAYPQPDITSKNDSTQANFESTLDLEMVGSIAPGANAIEVYAPVPYLNLLDDCFATILNAPASSPLSHTVAISNSWGVGIDDPGYWAGIIDPLWQQYTQEAAALGISVLVSSGDGANLNGESPSYPATVAYNNYGVISIGGTQTYVTGTPSLDGSGTTGIANQSVWYNTPADGDGSQGGVSIAYPEPIWQQQSSNASSYMNLFEPQISGRGTPDISGIGSNMNITISYFYYFPNGTAEFNHTYRMIPIWGTSVASPLVAGVIADMDAALGSPEGYFEGLIYQLGQAQADGLYSNIQPFNDVKLSYNALYPAYPGYDLATGWGSINAYNFIMDQASVHTVTFTETGLGAGGSWSVTLDSGATLSSSGNSISFMAENGTHTYTVNNEAGQIPDVSSGTVNMAGANINLAVSFSNSMATGTGVNQIDAENFVSTPNAINFTFSALGPSTDLPMSENFASPHGYYMNTISVYLNGVGQVAVSLGSNYWEDNIVAPITINVNGIGWYNVTFPTLWINSGNYYLNVWIANTNYNTVSWGFNNNSVITPSTISINDIASYSLYSLQSYNNYYAPDPYHTAIYALGFNSNPPAIEGPSGTITTQINHMTSLTWDVTTGANSYGPQTYVISKNGTTIGSGNWISNNNISILVNETVPGMFEYILSITDSLGGISMLTTWVQVTGSPTTKTVTSTAISTSTVISTVTKSGNVSTSVVTSTKSTPGFEILVTFLGLAFFVTIFLRKKGKK